MADKAIVAATNTAVTSERLAEFWVSHEGSACSIDTQILTTGLGTIVKATVKAGAYSITAHSETVVANVQSDANSTHNAELQAIERAMALFPVRG